MRVAINPWSVKLWLSPADTRAWASKPGAQWPCSTLAGKRLFAEFDRGGLVDVAVSSGNVDANEFNALTSDALRKKLPESHPAYFAAVGQFQG